jgi:hypothetical protein
MEESIKLNPQLRYPSVSKEISLGNAAILAVLVRRNHKNSAGNRTLAIRPFSLPSFCPFFPPALLSSFRHFYFLLSVFLLLWLFTSIEKTEMSTHHEIVGDRQLVSIFKRTFFQNENVSLQDHLPIC